MNKFAFFTAPAPSRLRRRLCTALLLSPLALRQAAGATLAAAGDPLDRPALPARQLARTLLLDVAYAGSMLVAVGERGIIACSADEGRNWQQVDTPTSVTLTAVSFQDERRGLAVGHGGVILATEDGGRTWRKRLDGRQIGQLTLQAAQRGGQQQALAQAQRLIDDGPDKPLLALQRLGGQRMLAVGAYNMALYSEDGGANWSAPDQPLDNPMALHIYAVRASGKRVLLAGEQGLVLLSEDGGRRFKRLASPYRGSYFSAEIAPDGGLWLAGLRGNVWHSSDGGNSWQVKRNLSDATVTQSVLLNGEPVLATLSGQLLRSRGDTLVPVLHTPLPPIQAILPLRSGGMLVLTVAGAVALPAAAMDIPKVTV